MVEAPNQRNSREEDAIIQADTVPTDWTQSKCTVYADRTYRSKEYEATLAAANLLSPMGEKGVRGSPLTDNQKERSRIQSTLRARIEHGFGAQCQYFGL